jgi:hypothetical protein
VPRITDLIKIIKIYRSLFFSAASPATASV